MHDESAKACALITAVNRINLTPLAGFLKCFCRKKKTLYK